MTEVVDPASLLSESAILTQCLNRPTCSISSMGLGLAIAQPSTRGIYSSFLRQHGFDLNVATPICAAKNWWYKSEQPRLGPGHGGQELRSDLSAMSWAHFAPQTGPPKGSPVSCLRLSRPTDPPPMLAFLWTWRQEASSCLCTSHPYSESGTNVCNTNRLDQENCAGLPRWVGLQPETTIPGDL